MSDSYFFILAPSAGPAVANHDAGDEQREDHDRKEEDEVARIERSLLESLEMGQHRKTRDGLDHGGPGPPLQEAGDRIEPDQDEQHADHQGDDESDDLAARHGRGHGS